MSEEKTAGPPFKVKNFGFRMNDREIYGIVDKDGKRVTIGPKRFACFSEEQARILVEKMNEPEAGE
jgi:hypothetical protein